LPGAPLPLNEAQQRVTQLALKLKTEAAQVSAAAPAEQRAGAVQQLTQTLRNFVDGVKQYATLLPGAGAQHGVLTGASVITLNSQKLLMFAPNKSPVELQSVSSELALSVDQFLETSSNVVQESAKSLRELSAARESIAAVLSNKVRSLSLYLCLRFCFVFFFFDVVSVFV
jgi:hypothetical protein